MCINASDAEADLENTGETIALRLGFNQISGLLKADAEALVAARHQGGAFDSVADCAARAAIGVATLERLARADAFAALGLTRRQALWAVRALAPESKAPALPLFDGQGVSPAVVEDEHAALPALPPGMEVLEDYAALRLSLKTTPWRFCATGWRHSMYSRFKLAKCPQWQTHHHCRFGDLSPASGQCQRRGVFDAGR